MHTSHSVDFHLNAISLLCCILGHIVQKRMRHGLIHIIMTSYTYKFLPHFPPSFLISLNLPLLVGRCATGSTPSWPWTLQYCCVTLACLCFRTWWRRLRAIMWEWCCPLSCLLQTERCSRTCCPRWLISGFRSALLWFRSATARHMLEHSLGNTVQMVPLYVHQHSSFNAIHFYAVFLTGWKLREIVISNVFPLFSHQGYYINICSHQRVGTQCLLANPLVPVGDIEIYFRQSDTVKSPCRWW